MTVEELPLIKVTSEEKELHEARLGASAETAFDVHAYVDDFNDAVVGAYRARHRRRKPPRRRRRGAQHHPARHRGGPRLLDARAAHPRLRPERCVGCMACVTTCPDTAILGVAQPASVLEPRSPDSPPGPRTRARLCGAHFARPRSTATVPLGGATSRRSSGSSSTRRTARAVASASRSATRSATTRWRWSTRRRQPPAASPRRALRARLQLLPQPAGDAGRIPQREGTRRPDARRARPGLRRRRRLVLRLRRGDGAAHARRRHAAGPRPRVDGHRRRDRLQHGLRQHLPVQPVPRAVDELAVRERARPTRWASAPDGTRRGHADRRLWVVGGDGAMYDIGFQSLSRMVASGADIKVLVLDTQVYSNTGGQASTASFGGQVTKLSAFGTRLHGRPERRKELSRILMAHGEVYVAQTTPAHVNHFYRAVMDANEYPGPAVIVAYTPCQPEHGIADDASNRRRSSRSTRAHSRCSPTTRGAASTWRNGCRSRATPPRRRTGRLPDGSRRLVAFARSEGRFAPHFGADGTPARRSSRPRPTASRTGAVLQELAGTR